MRNMSSSQVTHSEPAKINLQEIFGLLWESKWIILLTMVIALVIGIYTVSRRVDMYESELLLQIKSNSQYGGLASQLSQRLSIGRGQSDTEATQIALIKSRFILASVIKSLGLDISVTPKQSRLKSWFSSNHPKMQVKQFEVLDRDIKRAFTLVCDKPNQFSFYDSHGQLLFHGVVGKLARSADKTISLRVESIDAPINTTFIVKKMPSLFITKSMISKLKIADLGENRQLTGVLALTINDTNPKMAARILNAVGKTVQAKDVQKNSIEASRTLDFLYQQLLITKQDLEKAELQLNRYRAKSGKIDIKIQASSLLRQLEKVDRQLTELKIEKIDKVRRYTNEHPVLIGLNTKAQELRNVRNNLEKKLKNLPASDQIAMNLLRDVKVKTTLYMLLMHKIQELKVVKAGIVSDVRILTLAKPATEPLPRARMLVYAGSLIFGLMLGFLIVFVRKFLFPRIDDPHWSERNFNLVNLAIVPYSKEQTDNFGFLRKGQVGQNFPLLAHINPKNLAIESLRSLRTSLQVRLSCSTNNVVAILGVSPGVGKSFVSANLAYLLATAGKRIVVIDADMRRGTLHKYFNFPAMPGLAEILNNKNTLDEVLKKTVNENLMIISRGAYPDDPSELLTSDKFKELIHTLSQQFDIVLFDTPPVLLVTDSVLIGVHAGTNYLVVGAKAHQPVEIEMTIKRLTNSGVSLDGTIFNFHKYANLNSYKYGYNKYGYYYDDKETTKP